MKVLFGISLLAFFSFTADALDHHFNGEWDEDGGGCGVEPPTLARKTAGDRAVEKYRKRRRLNGDMAPPSFEYDVYWHILEDSQGKGAISDDSIAMCMNLLNEGFSGDLVHNKHDCEGNVVSGLETSVRFQLKGVSRTVNDNFFTIASTSVKQGDIQEAFNQGDCSTMNVYTARLTDAGGFATIAPECVAEEKMDSVYIDYREMPSNETQSEFCDLFVHEVGHWVGLEHPFEGDCDDGDFVHDTPAQLQIDGGCPIGSDTCPGGGLDSIHNYMSYTDNCCIHTFTSGQVERMHALLEEFRPTRDITEGMGLITSPVEELSIVIPPSTRDESYWNASFDDYYDYEDDALNSTTNATFDDNYYFDDLFSNATNATFDDDIYYDDLFSNATNATFDDYYYDDDDGRRMLRKTTNN